MKRLRVLISILFAFLVAPNFVLAATTERTTTLDLTSLDLTIDQESVDEGWSFKASESLLTLTDVNFNIDASDDYGLVLPSDMNITINLIGENKITAKKPLYRASSLINNGTITVSGDGSLELVSTNELPSVDLVNLTIESGKINVIGGTVNILQTLKVNGGELIINTSSVTTSGFGDGIYANGAVEITDGKVDIDAKENGIVVDGDNALDPTIGINITGGEVNINALLTAMYAGDSSVIPAINKDIVIDGTIIDFKESPIGIFSSQGNITINDSVIKALDTAVIYEFDSNNTVQVANIGQANLTSLDSLLLTVPTDLTIYTDDTVNNLNGILTEINSFDRDNATTLDQFKINEFVTELKDALNNLQIKLADYSELTRLLDGLTSNITIYTQETVSALNDVIDSIDYDKNITEQNIVNQYVSDLKKALNNLVLKRADYSKIDELINSVDLSKYTEESVTKFNNFISSIDRNISILNQEKVDAYIDELNSAINCLITKPIDKVDEIIDSSNTVVSNDNHYTDNSISISDDTSDDESNNDSKIEDEKDDDSNKEEVTDDQKDTDSKTDKKVKKSSKVLLIILWIVLGLIGLALVAFVILLIIKKRYAAKRRKQAAIRRSNVLKTSTTAVKSTPEKETSKKVTKGDSTQTKKNSTTKKPTTKKTTTKTRTTTKRK